MVVSSILGLGALVIIGYIVFQSKDAIGEYTKSDEQKSTEQEKREYELANDKEYNEVGFFNYFGSRLFGTDSTSDKETEELSKSIPPAEKYTSIHHTYPAEYTVTDNTLSAQIQDKTGGALSFSKGKIIDTDGNQVFTVGLLQSLPTPKDKNKIKGRGKGRGKFG